MLNRRYCKRNHEIVRGVIGDAPRTILIGVDASGQWVYTVRQLSSPQGATAA